MARFTPSLPKSERSSSRRSGPLATAADDKRKKQIRWSAAWSEARDLVHLHRRRLALGLALMLMSQAAGLVLPASSKFFIDDVIGKGKLDLLMPLALAVGAATVVQSITTFALSQVLGVAAQRAIADMRRRVQAHAMHLPTSYYDSTQTGVLISRIMTDAEGIRNLVGSGLVQLVGGSVTAIIALGVLFYLNWKLTALMLLVLGSFGVAMAIGFKRLRPLFRERGKINAEVTGRLNEALGGIRIVKTYTAEEREKAVFTEGVDRLYTNIAKSITGVSTVMAFSGLVIGAIGVLMIIMGGQAIVDKQMTIGDFVLYLVFTGMVAAPIVQIASIGTQITEAFAGLDRIRELTETPAETAEDATRQALSSVDGRLSFEDVHFAYVEGVPVLRGITFDAPAGTTTALVGSSGSGKSTLIGLVMAFHRPKSGRVLVDGHDLAGVRLRDYRRFLGVVLQDNFLFDGTVADNIKYSKPDATRDEVQAVSRIAHADEFIQGFPEGYDTIVGERGVKLSGGQRQRVAIARAILANPKILILDEATSSLDSESEALIQDGLRRLRAGRTTFVIAHRLSTIRSADQILVIEGGEVVERGTHAELIALDGRYRQLYDKQYNFETDRFINPGEDFTPEPPKAPKLPGAATKL
ncbi:MAG: ABC transporter ATP-binding protein/permease [Acidobacteriota bacterium]|nr:ABC transporter ATP-binding protein/permease [Acidobacteriota bacterium]